MGPIRRTADRIWYGSAILRRRYTTGLADWIRDGERLWERWLRLACLAALTWGAWRALRAWPWLWWPATAWWCAAAWWTGRPERADDEEHAQPVEQAPNEESDERPHDTLPGILLGLIGDAPGVHLKTVVQHLHKTRLDRACTKADVEAALDRRGIPIRPSVRDARQKVNKGVHGDDLRAWLAASPTVPTAPPPRGVATPATTPVTSGVADAATPSTTPATAPRGARREGFDAHADDALGLVAPRRSGAA